jgi:hypothetical protein
MVGPRDRPQFGVGNRASQPREEVDTDVRAVVRKQPRVRVGRGWVAQKETAGALGFWMTRIGRVIARTLEDLRYGH